MYEKVKVYLTLKQTQIEFQSPFSKIEKAVPRTIYEGTATTCILQLHIVTNPFTNSLKTAIVVNF